MPSGPLEVVQRPDLIQRRQLAGGQVGPEQVRARVRKVDERADGGHAGRETGGEGEERGVHGGQLLDQKRL